MGEDDDESLNSSFSDIVDYKDESEEEVVRSFNTW